MTKESVSKRTDKEEQLTSYYKYMEIIFKGTTITNDTIWNMIDPMWQAKQDKSWNKHYRKAKRDIKLSCIFYKLEKFFERLAKKYGQY